ncbi:hypothetical protein IJ670_02840 [bacterium]|nr:hypothetical protein [bacterium]
MKDKIVQFFKNNDLYLTLSIIYGCFLLILFSLFFVLGGPSPLLIILFLLLPFLGIFLYLCCIVAIIINCINKPNTTFATLILIVLFCLLITPDKLLFVCISASCVLILSLINLFKKSYILKHSGMAIVILSILINIFMIQTFTLDKFILTFLPKFLLRNKPSNVISQRTKSIFTNKVGYKLKYCPNGTTCKEYKIPKQYDKIAVLNNVSGCPYFKAYIGDKKIYIDKDNKQILPEFDTVEYVEPNSKNNVAISDNYYFKVSKDDKYGLYQLPKYRCSYSKMVIPCEADDIQLQHDSKIQFIIVKKNGLYSLYARLDKFDGPPNIREDFELLYENQRNIKILTNTRKPNTIKIKYERCIYEYYSKNCKNEYDYSTENCTKIKVDDGIVYLCYEKIMQPLDKYNTLYTENKWTKSRY